MAERLNLTKVDQQRPGTRHYRPSLVSFDLDAKVIRVVFVGAGGIERPERWRDGWAANDIDGDPAGRVATQRMRNLFKADLRAKSLPRRLMEMAVDDGRFEGSISGTPD